MNDDIGIVVFTVTIRLTFMADYSRCMRLHNNPNHIMLVNFGILIK